MTTNITPATLAARADLVDWRVLRRRLEACFRAPSFGAAAVFVGQIASAADAADHHPDVDLRYPGRVHVRLTTHFAHGLTDLDAALAVNISVLAERAGITAEPHPVAAVEVAIDAVDIAAVRPFWGAVLGYVDQRPAAGEAPNGLVDPHGIGPGFWFQQMDAPRPQRSRVHIDVIVAHDEAESRVAAALAAGGRLVSDAAAKAFWVLADSEGNEACVCTWQDRD